VVVGPAIRDDAAHISLDLHHYIAIVYYHHLITNVKEPQEEEWKTQTKA